MHQIDRKEEKTEDLIVFKSYWYNPEKRDSSRKGPEEENAEMVCCAKCGDAEDLKIKRFFAEKHQLTRSFGKNPVS